MSILRLAIPSPLRTLFDYLPPSDFTPAQTAALRPGVRVIVPFGRRQIVGYLVTLAQTSTVDHKKLRNVIEILDEEPLISAVMLQVCVWAMSYYQHPPGEVMIAAFAPPLRAGKLHEPLGEPGWALTTHGKGLPDGALKRSPKQALALKILQEKGSVVSAFLSQNDISSGVMRTLREKGLVVAQMQKSVSRTPTTGPALSLNEHQLPAVSSITAALGSFSCHLLEGVTGSGKTEVYLHLVAEALKRGQQVLILVPEIGLTPQTYGRFEQRFDANIVCLHSGMTDLQRYRAWEAARDGSAHLILGTRSAVFAPTQKLGLIIVDEEHDNSYKQQDGFRYSARDIAVKRGQLEGCPVLLGSATPSIESIYNASQQRYQHHILPVRAAGSTMPALLAVDVRKQQLTAGLSAALIEAAEKTLTDGQQVLLFLNRRGFAPTLQCHDCGWIAQCNNCDARLTVHRRRHKLRCHHCAASLQLPQRCPSCHSSALLTAGLGTEQTEQFLRQRFPSHTIYRVDSDSMTGRDAMQNLSQELLKGEPCILLGTQMLTKGHHFPSVSLVGVIDVDSALFSSDFRGEERMAQMLTQVGGRAGRAEFPGQVILQTHYPDHPALLSMLHTSYAKHARDILKQRVNLGLPPIGQMLVIRTDCSDMNTGEQFLHNLRKQVQVHIPPGTTLIGPLPSPMQRRAGKFRSQMMVMASSRKDAHTAAAIIVAAAQRLPTRQQMKWSIDVDPQDTF
jgi:primosomal protein N' (replication factor Y)